MVVACLALFVALGGSAWAAVVVSSNSQIAPNTIYGANKPASANDNIVDGSINTADIKSSAIGSNRIADGSILTADIGDNTIGSADLADNSVTNVDVRDGSLRAQDLANGVLTGAKMAPDTLTGAQIDESTLGRVPNAGALDGNTSGAFYHRQMSAQQRTSDCVGAPQTWVECAPIAFTVPAGHIYLVTVFSSVTANPGNAFVEPLFCPASTGPSCVSGVPDRVTFEPNQYGNWSSSYTDTFFAGAYRFNTAMKWPFALPAISDAYTETTIIVSDYRQIYLTGP
jgi:hypothetical protein